MKILDNSLKISLGLNGTEPYNVYSFLYLNNRLISVGRNNMTKTCLKTYKIGKQFNIEKFIQFPFPHSELDCVAPLWRRGELTGKEKLVVVRLSKRNTPALAKPCSACHSFLSAINLRNVYYTSESGWKNLDTTI